MKVTIEKITITITREEALSIRNELKTATDNKVAYDKKFETLNKLDTLLKNNFDAYIEGVHSIRE